MSTENKKDLDTFKEDIAKSVKAEVKSRLDALDEKVDARTGDYTPLYMAGVAVVGFILGYLVASIP